MLVLIRTALYGLGNGGGRCDMAAGFIPDISNADYAAILAKEAVKKVINLITCF